MNRLKPNPTGFVKNSLHGLIVVVVAPRGR